ncbi:pseudouridine synthase-like protein TruD/Pus7 [Dendryphion nanum]|uniref:Pseudouridine synthase-like protein TruD/Pus7 n=1 Tax=Dendryphion nanum TaxID=256645 RepID=A0A9P9DXU5_9PLEO|nr:pseudouridine synthase-like protein TruD/Pus7 [Dendryphion nanum]
MENSSDPDTRPHKRVRVENGSTAPSITAEPVVTDAAQGPVESTKDTAISTTTSGIPIAPKLTDFERETKAGITEYVSQGNLGFSGVLKQRYTDFLVNEIGLDGNVIHLRSTGVTRDKKTKGKETEAKEESNIGQDVRMEDVKVEIEQQQQGDANGTANDAPKEETKVPAVIGQAEIAEDQDGNNYEISDEDLQDLHSIFGETTTSEVVKLVQAVRKHPERKAKEFKAVIAAPIPDKEQRTLAHQTLRRVFPNILESGMEQDQSIRIKASPPVNRNNKRKRGGDRERDSDRHRGQLAWEERGGEFLHFTLYKENKDTMEVVGFLGSVTGGGSKSYTFAGTKDRRACTAQRVCVKRQSVERVAGIANKLYNAAIGDYEYKRHDLRLGDLLGNEFTITLRDCHFEKEEERDVTERMQLANEIVSRSVQDFSERGFINYYGLQRFGSFAASTDTIGTKLLQENFKGAVNDLLAYSEMALAAANNTEENPEVLISQDDRMRAKGLHIWRTKGNGGEALRIIPRKFSAERNIIQHLSSRNKTTKQHDRLEDYKGALMTIPRNLRLMYVHAYQSLVWNTVAGKRWTTYGSKVMEGDLVLVHEHKDKEDLPSEPAPDTVDQDGEFIINPEGEDSALKDEDQFERARPLSQQEAESGRYTIWDVVLPQPGYDVEYPRNAIGNFYKEFMGSKLGGGLDPYNMRRRWREISLSGGYRKFLARPMEPLSFTIHEYTKEDEQFVETDLERLRKRDGESGNRDGNGARMDDVKDESNANKKIAVVLKLQLASSQYATVALRELMKAGGVKAFQPQFMGGR